MKQENIGLVKQAIIDEYGISNELATLAARSALEAVGKSLVTLADKILKPKEGKNEAN